MPFVFDSYAWRTDIPFHRCAPHTRLIWLDMLCVIADCENLNPVTLGNKIVTDREWHRLCRTNLRRMRMALRELAEYGFIECSEQGVVSIPSGNPFGYYSGKRTSISRDIRESVYDRDQYACQSCGASANLTVDHIRPVKRGGTNAMSNLRTLCRPCNSAKGARYGA